MHRDHVAGRLRVVRGYGAQLLAERLTTQARHQRDAEPGTDQRQVGVELHRGVRDPGQPAAALVLQAQVIFTILIAAGVLRELPTPPQVLGVVVGAVGLAVVAVGRGGQVTMLALVLCLLGALSWGIGNVISRASGVAGGLSLTVWSALVVPVSLVALSLVIDGPAVVGDALASFSWQAAVSTLYTAGLASLVGYGVFNTLLSRNVSSSVVPWVLLAPVVAMASAWALLDQRPSSAGLLGGLLLIVGVLVAMRPARRTSGGRTLGADVGDGGHRGAELGEPVVLVLPDEPDAPGERVRT